MSLALPCCFDLSPLSLRRTARSLHPVHRLHITVSSLLVVFLFIFYLYPPAQHSLTPASELDMSVLFLGVEPFTGANPHLYASNLANFPVYLLYVQLIVLLLSFMVAPQRMVVLGSSQHMSANEFYWLLYVVCFYHGPSVLADLLGLLSAT